MITLRETIEDNSIDTKEELRTELASLHPKHVRWILKSLGGKPLPLPRNEPVNIVAILKYPLEQVSDLLTAVKMVVAARKKATKKILGDILTWLGEHWTELIGIKSWSQAIQIAGQAIPQLR